MPALDASTNPCRDNYRFLARYNQWFNARLLDAVVHLPAGTALSTVLLAQAGVNPGVTDLIALVPV